MRREFLISILKKMQDFAKYGVSESKSIQSLIFSLSRHVRPTVDFTISDHILYDFS
jgi:hypothetical protein